MCSGLSLGLLGPQGKDWDCIPESEEGDLDPTLTKEELGQVLPDLSQEGLETGGGWVRIQGSKEEDSVELQ